MIYMKNTAEYSQCIVILLVSQYINIRSSLNHTATLYQYNTSAGSNPYG